MIKEARQVLYESLSAIYERGAHTERQKEKAHNFFTQIIESALQAWANQLEIDTVFKKLPNRGYPGIEDSKKQTLKWFIKYSYKLRNVLFHIIIDPFDQGWQPIYKNTYTALKVLVDQHITKIETPPPIE